MSSPLVDNEQEGRAEGDRVGEEELLSVDEMPMPMDSEEALQGFALSLKDSEDLSPGHEEINANQSIREEVEAEGWYKRYCRWVPTSPVLLEQAEKKVLSYVKTIHEGRWVNIGADPGEKGGHCKWSLWGKPEERKVWTLIFNKDAEATPLVIIHGLCASVGLWSLNIDALAEKRPLYAMDLIGFGRSSRPRFSRDALEAENQHVEAIEAWRKEMKLERFVLLGHSMGGFISASYALKYPERVAHLVLADPWGLTEKPDDLGTALPANVQQSYKFKVITTVGQHINPLGIVRALGPIGPGILGKVRPDLVSKFQALNQDGGANIAEYIYHCNAGNPTGEEAFRTMMNFFGWAKHPMCNRLHELKSDIPLTMMYGDNTWLRKLPKEKLNELRGPETHTEFIIVPHAGHHIYADNQSFFNSAVNKAASIADKILHPNRIS